MISEFKGFEKKDHVVDMAIGVGIGGAFESVVTSLPMTLDAPDPLAPRWRRFSGLVHSDQGSGWRRRGGRHQIQPIHQYATALDFLIISFAIFLVVKAMNTAMDATQKKRGAVPEAPPEPSKEEVLLTARSATHFAVASQERSSRLRKSLAETARSGPLDHRS